MCVPCPECGRTPRVCMRVLPGRPCSMRGLPQAALPATVAGWGPTLASPAAAPSLDTRSHAANIHNHPMAAVMYGWVGGRAGGLMRGWAGGRMKGWAGG